MSKQDVMQMGWLCREALAILLMIDEDEVEMFFGTCHSADEVNSVAQRFAKLFE